MGRYIVIAAALAAFTAACKDKSKSEGLPPAQEWSANTGNLTPAPQPGGGAMPGAGANPHAGMGGANGVNPHAGVPGMGGADDPHAGLDMGGGSPDVAKMGLPPPDPNRKIDPTRRVKGLIKIHAKAKDRIAAGGAVFVTIKKAGPDGQPSGPPLAVDRLTWQQDPLPFEMTEAQAMIAGTELVGDVVVTARYDQDGDAISKQPGDIVGVAKVKVPADNVNVTLDEILP
jgi:hypothetical protein